MLLHRTSNRFRALLPLYLELPLTIQYRHTCHTEAADARDPDGMITLQIFAAYTLTSMRIGLMH